MVKIVANMTNVPTSNDVEVGETWTLYWTRMLKLQNEMAQSSLVHISVSYLHQITLVLFPKFIANKLTLSHEFVVYARIKKV